MAHQRGTPSPHSPGFSAIEFDRRRLLQGAIAAGALAAVPRAARADDAAVKRGGTLRIGFVGNGTAETLDPNANVAIIDSARSTNLFDQLVKLKPDLSLSYELAESMESNDKADLWTIRLRSGVIWHDGSQFKADDVIYTIRRIADQNNALNGKETTMFIDVDNIRKVDDITLELPLAKPNSELPYFFSQIHWLIVKDGTTDFSKPIGTGPFQFISFAPGQESVFRKWDGFWQPGKPYVDELQFLTIPDQQTRLNALLGGQIDAMESMSFAQTKEQIAAGQIEVLIADGPNMVPIYMAVDLEPFTDVRVRHAMRLIAGRPQLMDVAQFGFGQPGNDLYGRGMPFYNDTLTQRVQDIERAKALLQEADKADLRITLYTSTVAPGMLESATAFAEQAKKAGVTIEVQNVPADQYFGEKYLKLNFAQSLWFSESIITHVSKSLVKGAPYNETHWENASFQALYERILSEVDTGKRRELYFDLQKMLWEEGGYLIWATYPLLDGMSKAVKGVVANPAQPLGNYAFRDWWLA